MKLDQGELVALAVIAATVVLSGVWSVFNAFMVLNIEVSENSGNSNEDGLQGRNINGLVQIGGKIQKGAQAFLNREYLVMLIFVVIFSVVVFVLVDIFGQDGDKTFRCYATVSYIIGSLTSMVCGYIGMRIAVAANFRTTFKAITSLEGAFNTAFQAGCVMGFSTCSLALGILAIIMVSYIFINDPVVAKEGNNYQSLMDLIAGYGLGGSSMALFGRVGGGIYTKAADVGADLVGKVEEGLDEDSPRNPATIADNVGDNVGDIAGMGSDLFGSFAESTCASLVLIASIEDLLNQNKASLYYPLIISAGGIVACFLTSIVGIYIYRVNSLEKIERALNLQLLVSTVLMAIILLFLSWYFLPDKWMMTLPSYDNLQVARWWHCYVSTALGLISGFVIGLSTDYYTSNAHRPVQEMANICQSGAAINVIYGLALGYLSTIIPVILLAITIIVSSYLIGMLGVALAAIGMLSTLSISLAIDAYGPISDNAGGIAEMAEIGDEVREKTDALDAAGNTTAAVGKGFAIGSAALVSLALYGAFLTRCAKKSKGSGRDNSFQSVQVNDGWIFGSMFIGAMLPYAFSALTMKSVGDAANEMVEEVRRQFQDAGIKNGEKEPDYERCIQVSTNASIREMILPGCLVIFTPIAFGVFLHPKLVAGLLPGALLSGIQLAISMANTGGAWDNAKKHIEQGEVKDKNGVTQGKGSEAHKAAVTGDTIGDPLKDTSGPSLNILVKLMAIISLVFAEGFKQTAFLGGVLNIK